MPRPAYRGAYLRARAELVADWGRCAWCGRPRPPGLGDADHLYGLGSPVLVRACTCQRPSAARYWVRASTPRLA